MSAASRLVTRIAMRSDTEENWERNSDVVLLKGEIAIVFDSRGHAAMKIGDGVRKFSEIGFIGFETQSDPDADLLTSVDERQYIDMIFGDESDENESAVSY